MRLQGPVFVYAPKLKLKAIVDFGQLKNQKTDELSGGIYRQLEDIDFEDKKLKEKLCPKNYIKNE